MDRYQKFIVIKDLYNNYDIRLGYHRLYSGLIYDSDKKKFKEIKGGGFWEIDFDNKEIHLYYDFTKFDKSQMIYIEEAVKQITKYSWSHEHYWWQFKYICKKLYKELYPDITNINDYKFVVIKY